MADCPRLPGFSGLGQTTLAGDSGNGLNAKLGLRRRRRSQVYQGKLHRFIVSFHFSDDSLNSLK
jgi:hypothetical protein